MNLHPSHARRGFVLPVVLGIILLAGLFAVHAATELGSTTLLASQRLLHQRAFEAGESGLAAAMAELRDGRTPASSTQLRISGAAGYTATVNSSVIRSTDLSSGFSAGRIVETDYELRSMGHSARGAEVVIVQGARQRHGAPP